ncbi:MAG: energy-coupling factor transporter transmembrane component T [Oscillospiraceae bacterium]|nr:energy-coupling factor transporter transmembrane component T [Oscillospiraceae bacterium]
MLKDITLGQYLFGDSPVHKLDPRLKILLTIAYIVLLFTSRNLAGVAVAMVFCAAMFALAKVPLRMIWRSIRPILPIVIFTSVLNLFFVSGGTIFEWWIFKISREGLYFSAMISLRIVALLAGTALLTYTTSPIELTDAIERLLSPLKVFKLPVHELAMMMTIALRFIPTLIEETDKIMSAQKSRGANLDTGTFRERVRALTPILVPLFISAFRRADELALAMECRCYRGGEGRTRLKQLHFHSRDLVALLVFAAVFAAVLYVNTLFPAVI